jgi:hypothetical protein
MFTGPIAIETFSAELARLSAPKILGLYNLCEVTEVVGFTPEQSVINLFSIIVFEEHPSTNETTPRFLNDKRIRIPDLKQWSFGIYRYHITPRHVYDALNDYTHNGIWQLSGNLLGTRKLIPTRSQFVPPDATETVALNRVLKNNFWNGSYAFELFDTDKKFVMPLIEDPRRLQKLSEAIQGILPLKIASLADRLGNIIFQIPVKVLMSQFSFKHDHGTIVTLAWDSRVSPRKCRIFSLMELDGVIHGFGTGIAINGDTDVNTIDSSGLNRNILWDEEERVILATSAPLSFIREVNFTIMPVEAEPRTVVIPQNDSSIEQYRVQCIKNPIDSRVGDSDVFAYRKLIHQRIYNEERYELERKRFFVQYGLDDDKKSEQQRALNDLNILLDAYGREGAWIWDPFLSAVDIMRTLFCCKYYNANLRALGAFEKRTRIENNLQFPKWKQKQVNDFKTGGNNYYGLNLEFRVRYGSAGWSFHDRFLIFPHTKEGALAWSLGTSINNIGTCHHILHRVDNGQLIADAFVDLWDKLDAEDFLVWRHP